MKWFLLRYYHNYLSKRRGWFSGCLTPNTPLSNDLPLYLTGKCSGWLSSRSDLHSWVLWWSSFYWKMGWHCFDCTASHIMLWLHVLRTPELCFCDTWRFEVISWSHNLLVTRFFWEFKEMHSSVDVSLLFCVSTGCSLCRDVQYMIHKHMESQKESFEED